MFRNNCSHINMYLHCVRILLWSATILDTQTDLYYFHIHIGIYFYTVCFVCNLQSFLLPLHLVQPRGPCINTLCRNENWDWRIFILRNFCNSLPNKSPILKKKLQKFQRLVLGFVELIDAKGIDVAYMVVRLSDISSKMA